MDYAMTRRKISIFLPLLLVMITFLLLIIHSADAIQSAQSGLAICARVIIPSLLPFYVLSGLLGALGLPHYLGRFFAPMMSRMFYVSGVGATAFILGLSGGYPLGAATVCNLYHQQQIQKKEAEHLLSFCNNSGPAFILGAAGIGIFQSPKVGLLLYAVHIISAILLGMLMSNKSTSPQHMAVTPHFKAVSFPHAFADCVKSSVMSTLTVCGFVVFFSVIVGILDAQGIFTQLAGSLSYYSGLELHFTRSLLTGFLELGSGIAAMNGLTITPANVALAAFILSFGGLSVHCQTLAVAAESDLSLRRHTVGKLLHGVIAAILILGISIFIPLAS